MALVGFVMRQDRVEQLDEVGRAGGLLNPFRHRQRMGPRQRRNALAQCLLQLLHRVCGPRAERYQAAGQREEILDPMIRSEEHTSELQSLMRISYAVFCLQKKIK